MDRDEWLARRRGCITGTDIAAICGVHRYKSAIRVWQEKLGLVEEPDLSDNQAVEWGEILERVIADEWAKRNETTITKGHFIQDEIFGGTPDFIVDGAGLEIKTGGHYTKDRWGEDGDQKIPDEYYLQCQWYMMLTGYDHWHVAVLLAGQDYRQYKIQRNMALIDRLRLIATEFWEFFVLTAEMPPADSSEDSKRALNAAYPIDDGDTLIAAYDDDEMAIELHQILSQIKDLEKKADGIKNTIMQRMADKSSIVGRWFKATWKLPKVRKIIDYKKMIEDLAIPSDVVKKYEGDAKTSRRFTFKYTGE